MIIKEDIALRDFDFWQGAKATVKILSNEELDLLDEILYEIYPYGLEPVELNDLFWFDDDFIAELLGYESWDAMYEERKHRL